MKKDDIIKRINESCKFLDNEPSLFVKKMSRVGIAISELKLLSKDYELNVDDVLDIIREIQCS